MNKLRIVLITLLLTIVIGLVAVYFYGRYFFSEHYLPGTEINGFDVSYLTSKEVEDLMDKKVKTYALAINYRNGGREKITAEQAGMTFVSQGNESQKILNEQPLNLWFVSQSNQYEIPAVYTIDNDKLKIAFESLACVKNMIPPVEARIAESEAGFYVIPQIKGTKLDEKKAYEAIETAIMTGQKSVDLESFYINPPYSSEEELQKKCDWLNSIRNLVITYDFGDRVEVVDFSVIRTWLKDYSLDRSKINSYIKNLAKKYDTVGKERKFRAYDGSMIMLEGGDYGWMLDVEQETDALMEAIESGETQVRCPVYEKEGYARDTNDLGFTYVEIDLEKYQIIFYQDGNPVIQEEIIYVGKDVPKGCYQVSEIVGSEYLFGNQMIYSSQNSEENMFSEILEADRENGIKVSSDVCEVLSEYLKIGMPVVIY